MNDDKLVKFKYLLVLAIPIFIELLLQMVVGYSDQIMMSKYPSAVTAITNCNTIINMVINSFTVFSTAAIVLITQYKGAKNSKKEGTVYSTSFFFNLFLSFLLSVLLVALARPIFKAMNVPSESYKEALKYMYIVGGFIFFQTMSTALSALLKSNSFMKETMIINVTVNIINIIGNLILIPHFKIVGVAISSTFSRMVGCIAMYITFRYKTKIRFSFKIFKENISLTLKKLLKLGAPSGGESISYNSSQIVIQVIINGFGIAICNIKTYASMFAMITYMFTSAISQAMQVIIGELLGAGRVEDASKKIKQTCIISIIVSTSIAIIFFIISKQVFRIFNVTDPAMLRLAQRIMFIEIFLEFGRAINIVFVRSLQTSGDVIFPTTIAIIFCWSVAVLGSFIIGSNRVLGYGLCGVWISMALDECIRACIFIFRFRSGKWSKKNLVEDN